MRRLGRSKKGNIDNNGFIGLGIIILLCLIVAYWHIIVIVGSLCFGGYILFKFLTMLQNKNQNKSYTTPGIPHDQNKSSLGISLVPGPNTQQYATHNSIKQKNIDEAVTFYEHSTDIVISNFQIKAYLLYFSRNESDLPHVVSTAKVTGTADKNLNAHMGYYPSYQSINLDDRATYLSWLSSGRSEPNADIGLVFLYFYGLEFRAIHDDKNHNEIFNEVVRLYNIYASSSGSFKGYASALITWLILNNPEWESSFVENAANILIENSDHGPGAAALKQIYRNLSDEDFTFYLMKLIMPSNSTLTEENYFRILFINKLKEDKKPKFILKTSASRYSYRSCSIYRHNNSTEYKKISFKYEAALSDKWSECIDELKEYTKLKADNQDNAVLFLPRTIQNQCDCLISKELVHFLGTEPHKIISIKDLLTNFKIKDAKIGVTTSKKISTILSNFNFEIEPDIFITDKIYKEDDSVIVYKSGYLKSDIDKTKFNKVSLFYDLGISVAKGDDQVGVAESKYVYDFVAKSFSLNNSEKERLSFREILFKAGCVNTSFISKKLSAALTSGENETVAKYLLSIASINGVLEDKKIKELQKCFKTLGFPEELLGNLIQIITSSPNNPVLIKEAVKKGKKGSEIPREDNGRLREVILNPEALRDAFADSEKVSKLLATVFTTSEDEELKSSAAKIVKPLDLKEHELKLLNIILTKSVWQSSEVEEHCRSYKTMYGAVINAINEWAEKEYGQSLLEEDGEELIVHKELMNQGAKSA